MLGDRLSSEMLEEINKQTSQDDLFLKWNIRRTRYVAFLYLFMQFLNMLDGGIFTDPQMFFSFACLVVLNVAFIVFTFIAERWKLNTRVQSAVHLAYWLALPFASAFFFVFDINAEGLPANLLVFYLFLSTIPVFKTKILVTTFAVPYALNALLGLLFGANASYFAYGLLFAICGLFVSLVSSRQYIMLIEQLRHTSTYDQLTSLLTRHIGIPRAEMLAASCRRNGCYFVAYMLDIDFFKLYNDSFGHLAGDAALKAVSAAVSECFKRADDVVMRFGGEEIAVFIAVDSPDCISAITENLSRAVEARRIATKGDTPKPFLTLSCGVYAGRVGANSDETLVVEEWTRKADEALYQAKNSGRARSVIRFSEAEVDEQ